MRKTTNLTQNKLQLEQINGFVRLFGYAMMVSEEIGENAWKILGRYYEKKRRDWINKNLRNLKLKGGDVEKAFQLLLLYFKEDPRDFEVIEKTVQRLVYRYYGFCPSLEACNILKLNTNMICPTVFGKSTEVLIAKINPNLKFKRGKIRPTAKYCEEIIELEE